VAHAEARSGCAFWGSLNRLKALNGRPWTRLAALLALATLACVALSAQTPDGLSKIVDSSQSSVLRNHHPLWANPQNDAGAVPPSQNFNQMTLVLARSPQQESAFEAFLADQQNPASPDYHHWLTPAEVGARFGLSDSDIASITGWLQSEGLHVNWIAPSHVFIGFGGAAADLNRAFQTELHYYNVHGTRRMAVASDPLVPRALAPAILAVRGLYTLEDRPTLYTNDVQSASPQLTTSNGSHFITPADFALIYDLPNLNDISGSNQTIAIVGRSRTNFADFTNFRSLTQSTFPNPTEVVPTAFGGLDPGPAYTTPPPSGTSLGDQSEATLDVLRAGSVAPAANLLLVVATQASGGIEVDAQYIVNTTPVPANVMSISFGACEANAGESGVNFWNTLLEQAAAEGISTFVSSGDSGASGCDTDFTTPPASPVANSINYICASSYATCVGGTEFNDAGGNYWSSDNNTNFESATGYIPEGGWNEPLNSSGAPQVAASGGGVSAYIPTPSWQTGAGVPAARAGRYTPDVSFSASCHDAYFACFAAGGASCVPASNGEFEFISFCGTSAAAPAMAGLTALLDQQKGAPQGNINQGLYLAAAAQSSVFHDATVASSGVTGCSVSTPSMCNNSAPGTTGLTGGQAGYLVGTGYDEVTGLGSPNGVYFLSSFAEKLTPTVTVTPTPGNITVVQPFTVSITVSGSSGYATPTGSVTLTSGTYTSAAATLTNGAASISVAAGALGSGSPQLSVKYTPDAGSAALYTTATGSNSISISLLNAAMTVTPSLPSVTTAQTLDVTIAVSGGSGNATPTGTVYLGSDNFEGSATLSSGGASFSIGPGLLAVGTPPLAARYVPDAQSASLYSTNYATGSVTVTGTATLTPTITVTPASTAIVLANPLQVSVTASGGSGQPAPTGSITLVSGAYSATAALASGTAAFTIPAQTLSTGVVTLTAIYTPDAASTAAYNNASGTASIQVYNPSISAPVVTLFPSASSILTTQSLSVNVTVSSGMGFPIPATGSVVLSGGGYNSTATPISGTEVTFNIPAGALAVGSDTLTASYTPDAQSSTVYLASTGTTTVTVATPAPPSFNIANGSITLVPGAVTGNSVNVTVTPAGGFTGSVTLTAAITSSPSGAQALPTLSFGNSSPVSITGAASATATLTIVTTTAGSASLAPANRALPWTRIGGAALACLLLFGIPGGKRRRNLFRLLALFAILAGGMAACGGGGSGGGGGSSTPGTTAGNYTITVTGTSGSTTSSGTVTLTIE